MALVPLSLTLQTVYAELAQQVDVASRDEASIDETEIKGIRYLRLRRSVGATRRIEHLGRADDPAVVARAEAARGELARRNARRELVAILRGAVPGPTMVLGRVLDAMAFAGLFESGGVLVGTAAYQCYSPLVGHVLPAAGATTQDADLATADLALSALDGTDGAHGILDILRWADPSFAPVMQLDPRRPASRFRTADGFLVDLLTPRRRRNDTDPMPLRNLRAGAAPLQHLDWLIADAGSAVALHGAGVRVRLPQPARYAVHKLIVAQRREGAQAAKRRKDLIQAKALFEALERYDPYALEDALAAARAKGREGWARPIARSLAEIDLAERWREPA